MINSKTLKHLKDTKQSYSDYLMRIMKESVEMRNSGELKKDFILKCGFLTEREEDEDFSHYVRYIYNDIVEAFKTISNKPSLSIDEYGLYILFKKLDENYSMGKFTFDTKNTPVIVISVGKQLSHFFDEKDFYSLVLECKTIIFHELVHFVNYYSDVNSQKQPSYPSGDITNPKEFNAYFHQYREVFFDILKLTIKNNESFEENIGRNVQDFINKFWDKMNAANPLFKELIYSDGVYKNKWLKRLYQLYYEFLKYYRTKMDQIEKDLK
jgi:hypothetical protein